MSDPLFNTAMAIHCQGLVKRFQEVVAVAGLDLAVSAGECFGLLGPNGAGKTTTVELLEGLLEPDQGEIQLLGQAWGQADRALRARLGVQLQETHLPERLTVEETVRLFRSFYQHGRDVDALISLLGLEEKRQAWVGKLSGGQRQRLSLACALVGDPAILFLDEPTTGLDPQARLRIWEVVEAFRAAGGTVLITTHYMEEASRLCDRVAIMDHGRIIAQGTPQGLIAGLGVDQVVALVLDRPLETQALAELPGVVAVTALDGRLQLSVREVAQALPALLQRLEGLGAKLQTLTTHQATLEDVFVHLTGRALRDG